MECRERPPGRRLKRLSTIIQDIGKHRGANTIASYLICELENLTKTHFARDEIMMEASAMPGLAIHTNAQAKFIQWLHVIHRAFAALSKRGPKHRGRKGLIAELAHESHLQDGHEPQGAIVSPSLPRGRTTV